MSAFILGLFLSISLYGCSDSQDSSETRELVIQKEETGDYHGIDLAAINDLAKNTAIPSYKKMSMAISNDTNSINVAYSYFDKYGDDVCLVAFSFGKDQKFNTLSTRRGGDDCITQAFKIAEDKQMLGYKAPEILSVIGDAENFDGFSIKMINVGNKDKEGLLLTREG